MVGRGQRKRGSPWVLRAAFGLSLLSSYFLTVCLLGSSVGGERVRLGHLALLVPLVAAGLTAIVATAHRRGLLSEARLTATTVAGTAAFACLLVADLVYSAYLASDTPDIPEDAAYPRLADPQIWFGEAFPRFYYPTDKNFFIHKPNIRLSAEVYGAAYDHPELLHSSVISDSVLERRRIEYTIDEHGFRNSTPPQQASVFALGDSFTFGNGSSQDRVWAHELERKLGRPVYNLGVCCTSPKQQLMLLEYLLDSNPESFRIGHLVWMIFEGNDLEESYETYHHGRFDEKTPDWRRPSEHADVGVFRDTVVESLLAIPWQLKHASILDRLRSGRVELSVSRDETRIDEHDRVDGVELRRLLYHSDRFGPRLFQPQYVALAAKPRAYVMDHPNRPLLDRTFQGAARLAGEHGFGVTIVIAPSASRLYAQHYPDHPQISDEPHFIDYVRELADRVGFDVVDLLPGMEAAASETLLYWRDDNHWNDSGNALVAAIVADHLHTQL